MGEFRFPETVDGQAPPLEGPGMGIPFDALVVRGVGLLRLACVWGLLRTRVADPGEDQVFEVGRKAVLCKQPVGEWLDDLSLDADQCAASLADQVDVRPVHA
jgi:hypothetical protein